MKNTNCPYCESPAKNKSEMKRNIYGILEPSMVHFQCGTSVRPGYEPAIAGRKCTAYISAYPLPLHLLKVHCGGAFLKG
jgi:hypothetical protein